MTISSLAFMNQKVLKNLTEKNNKIQKIETISKPVWKLLTLGHKDFFDELLFVWVLGELGKKVGDVDLELLRYRVFFLSPLSPRIESFYTLSCFVFLFEEQKDTLCHQVLLEGHRSLPGSWRVLFSLGYLHAFWFKEFKLASDYYKKASLLKGAPAYLEAFSRKLLTEGEGLSVFNEELYQRRLLRGE